MSLRLLAALALAFCLMACGGGGEDTTAPPPARQAAPPPAAAAAEPVDETASAPADEAAEFTDLSQPQAGETDPAEVRLAEVKLGPERVRQDSTLEVTVVTRPPRAPGTAVVVAFWINDRKVQETAASTLPAGKLKKGDGVFADVILLAGEAEIDRRRTELVLVENSDPEIEAIEFPPIKGPGDYVITVKAADPDGDELAYQLDGIDLPAWLRVERDGRILMSPGDDPPEILEFEVVVQDDDGGEARRRVTLKFTPPPQEEGDAAAEET